MRTKKNKKILFIAEGAAIIALLIILIVILHHRGEKNEKNTAAGIAYIEAEEAKDPAQALGAIKEAREASNGGTQGSSEASATMEDLAQQIASLEIREMSPEEIAMWRQRYGSTVVVGDSMTQAILEYDFLDENHVKFQRSISVGQLYELTQEALEMLPDRIIFFTGLNDVDVFENPEDYYNAYLDRVNQVRSFNPDIHINICSLLPPSEELASWREDLARSPEYDAELQRLCADTGVNYIDLHWMVRQELYLEDGIHFNYDFYTIWMQYVALAAGI